MSNSVLAAKALGMTVVVEEEPEDEYTVPFNPATDKYRSVVVSLKVGEAHVFSRDMLLRAERSVEEQVDEVAAELLRDLWGVRSEYRSNVGEKDILPDRSYNKNDPTFGYDG